jgi:hypothetical protein
MCPREIELNPQSNGADHPVFITIGGRLDHRNDTASRGFPVLPALKTLAACE